MDIKKLIRTIPNFPKEGILFRDITTLLSDPIGFTHTIDLLKKRYDVYDIDYIAGIEARGFILGSALAYALNKGFVPIRKKGKLPGQTLAVKYQLEYGTDILEIHSDAIAKYSKILIIDDLMANGGTMLGAISLVKKIGGEVVETCCVIDLPELGGGKKIQDNGYRYHSFVSFDGA